MMPAPLSCWHCGRVGTLGFTLFDNAGRDSWQCTDREVCESRQLEERFAAVIFANMPHEPQCECHHDRDKHRNRKGKCTGLDSYGIRCTCPSYDPSEDDD